MRVYTNQQVIQTSWLFSNNIFPKQMDNLNSFNSHSEMRHLLIARVKFIYVEQRGHVFTRLTSKMAVLSRSK